MHKIPRNVLDLKPGLARTRVLEHSLQVEWGPRLARWNEIQRRVKTRHIIGNLLLILSALSGILFFCGLLCSLIFLQSPVDFSVYVISSVFMLGILGLAVAGMVVKKQAKKTGSHIPVNKRVPEVSSLTRIWWQELEAEAGRIEQKMESDQKYGDKGERKLIDALKDALPDTYFAVHGWKGVKNLDTDVLVFGPNGIWILESKYWSGTVRFDGNRWVRRKTFYLPGGIPETTEEVEKPIHQQWINEYQILSKTLRTEMPGWNFQIEGGIVFTLPEVELIIDKEKSCPVSVGKTNAWIKKIRQTPVISDMSEAQILMALDILLTYSHPFFDDPIYDSVQVAERAYYRQVQEFIQWRVSKHHVAL